MKSVVFFTIDWLGYCMTVVYVAIALMVWLFAFFFFLRVTG